MDLNVRSWSLAAVLPMTGVLSWHQYMRQQKSDTIQWAALGVIQIHGTLRALFSVTEWEVLVYSRLDAE